MSVKLSPEGRLSSKDLLGTKDLTREEIELILENAKGFRGHVKRTNKRFPALRGYTVVNLFYENSTRTRTSFELAGRRLDADVINFDVKTSSVNKGESLLDTVETIQALGADFIVMRHGCAGAHQFLARHVRASVLNAGDGAHEHPTQSLLDCFTITESLGTLEGKHVVIVGDTLHSRVTRSNIYAMKKLGATITLVGPPTLVPDVFKGMGVNVCHDFDEALRTADVVYMLRIQLERQAKNFLPSLKEYRQLYGLDSERLKLAPAEAIVLHPGPINFGVELTREVTANPRVKILDQITNGLAVRMACLFLLRGSSERG